MNQQQILNIIKCLSLVGMVVALYSLYEYYYGTIDSFCNISSRFSCYAVYQSEYSAIFGVPVALIGIIGYGFIFTLSHWGVSGKISRFQDLIFVTSLLAVIFSGRLVYISGFVTKVWCPSCIISYVIILAIFVCAVILKQKIKQQLAQ